MALCRKKNTVNTWAGVFVIPTHAEQLRTKLGRTISKRSTSVQVRPGTAAGRRELGLLKCGDQGLTHKNGAAWSEQYYHSFSAPLTHLF